MKFIGLLSLLISVGCFLPSHSAQAQQLQIGSGDGFVAKPGARRVVPGLRQSPGSVIKADLPHVRVTVVLDKVSHYPGLGPSPQVSLTGAFETTSSDVDDEQGSYVLPMPAIGGAWDFESLGGATIYEAIIHDACESLGSLSLTHSLAVAGSGAGGEFAKTDASTIDGTGFYPISYVVPVINPFGYTLISVTGQVDVVCSGQSSL